LGRNRKKVYQQLPKYVYVNRGRYIYRPPGAKDIVLGKVSSLNLPGVWESYKQLTGESTETLDYVVQEYLNGTDYTKLKDQKERKRLLNSVCDTEANGRFGLKRYRDITPGTIRKYLDHKGNIAANREIAALSAAWSYCFERDILATPNPCKGVRRLKETPRKRYVTEDEYKRAYDLMPKHIQVAMELAYLCRMRLSEVLDARVKDIEEEGLNTRRLKGSDDALTLCSPRLQKSVNQGLDGCIRTPEMTIINRNGSPVRRSSFQTTWQRRMKNFEPRFSFHDLKARGVSDFDGDKKKASGHKSERMVSVYDRKRIEVDATE